MLLVSSKQQSIYLVLCDFIYYYYRLEKGQKWYFWFTPYVPLSLLQWYNLCVSYDSLTNDVIAILDKRVVGRFNNKDFEETPKACN